MAKTPVKPRQVAETVAASAAEAEAGKAKAEVVADGAGVVMPDLSGAADSELAALEMAVLTIDAEDRKSFPNALPLAFIDPAQPDTMVVVNCHVADGRRRAGRRWPHGETSVEPGELSRFELAQLAGDPMFTVRIAS